MDMDKRIWGFGLWACLVVAGLGVFWCGRSSHEVATRVDFGEEVWTKSPVVLKAAYPNVFPEDVEVFVGRAYHEEDMHLFATAPIGFSDAVQRCRKGLPGDWVEFAVDQTTTIFASPLEGEHQKTILIRNQYPLRYEVSTRGAVHLVLSKPVRRLDGVKVPVGDLDEYLIRLQASK